MCGICGVFTTSVRSEHKHLIHAILQNQHSRGPNHQAALEIKASQSEIYLGHNRLSIIDLSTDSNQPMWDATHRYCITYNGEIYNYLELRQILKEKGFEFKTNGDTEIILNAFAYWGVAALNYFEGPFAFALFDKVQNQLWLARDRFGVRPLYYMQKDQTLYFSSSTPILAKLFALKPNLQYVSAGLHSLVYENETDISPYEKMYSLPAGHYALAEFNQHTLTFQPFQYYNLIDKVSHRVSELSSKSADDLLQMIEQRLNYAVRFRLRSDVPLGITLSSGLDSSSVASLVNQQQKNVIGFSFGHPKNKKSEGPLVAQCAQYLGMNIEYISPTPQDMITALFNTIAAQDAPFGSLSIVAQYLLYQHIKTRDIKVTLGGQGGDESFMGYRKFMLFWLRYLFKEKKYNASFKYLIQLFPLIIAETKSLHTYWRHRDRYLKNANANTALQLPHFSPQGNFISNYLPKIRQIQDITHFSLPTLLRYEDRNAMAHGVESRLPFLDHHLVELGCALPETFKLKNGFGKWPIRQIMKNKIPNKIRLSYYKRGFDIPLNVLLKNGLGKAIRVALYEKPHILNEFLKKEFSVSTTFSDKAFLQRRQAIPEAITLLWLSKVLS